MTDAAIAALAAVGSGAVSGLFTWLAARSGTRWEQTRRAAARYADELRSFHRLEANYAERLAAATGENAKGLKTRMRDELEALGYRRPTLTEARATRARDRWSE